jgi:hypothetical protein
MTERPSIYTLTGQGQVVCRLCHGLARGHTDDCPVMELRWQVREVTAQLGMFVATLRETVDHLDAVLRGGPEETP